MSSKMKLASAVIALLLAWASPSAALDVVGTWQADQMTCKGTQASGERIKFDLLALLPETNVFRLAIGQPDDGNRFSTAGFVGPMTGYAFGGDRKGTATLKSCFSAFALHFKSVKVFPENKKGVSGKATGDFRIGWAGPPLLSQEPALLVCKVVFERVDTTAPDPEDVGTGSCPN